MASSVSDPRQAIEGISNLPRERSSKTPALSDRFLQASQVSTLQQLGPSLYMSFSDNACEATRDQEVQEARYCWSKDVPPTVHERTIYLGIFLNSVVMCRASSCRFRSTNKFMPNRSFTARIQHNSARGLDVLMPPRRIVHPKSVCTHCLILSVDPVGVGCCRVTLVLGRSSCR